MFRYIRTFFLSMALVSSAVLFAEDEGPEIRFVEPEAWQEVPVELPAYPDGRDMVEVPLQIAGSNLQLFIHEPSLTVGEDGVVRYSMLLRSPSGAENVFYEGIRCATHELRSYAYGSHQARWRALEEAWQPLNDQGVNRYRERLYRYYLCRPTVGPLTRPEILRRMRHGIPFDTE